MMWIDPNEKKPDADIVVLMRLDDEDYPVWPGFWDGETWRQADVPGEVDCAVIGWLHLENVAMALDGLKEGAGTGVNHAEHQARDIRILR